MEPTQPDPTEVPSTVNNPQSGVQPTIIRPTTGAAQPYVTDPAAAAAWTAPQPVGQPTGAVPAAGAPAPNQFATGFRSDVPGSGTPTPYLSPEASFGTPPLQPTNSSRFGGNRKRWTLIGGVSGLVLIAGVVFGWYLPNTPTNVWNTGLNRSGSALDSFVQSAASTKQLEKYKTSTASGTATAHIDGLTYSGSFKGSFDATTLNGSASFDMRSRAGVKQSITANILSQVPSGKLYPDVYLQVSGLKGLGLDLFAPGVSSYDGKWLYLNSDYLQSLSSDSLAAGSGGSAQLSATDVASLIKTATDVTKDYVFTTNADKAVFVKKSFVGKEQLDGMNTYHYKVGVNVAHVKAYCQALSSAVLSTPAYQHLTGKTSAQLGDAKKSANDDCTSQLTDASTSAAILDMWIDGHYKLVYKIRAYDESDRNTYTEIGQIYKGGNQVSLFVNTHDSVSPSDAKFTLNANLDTGATKATYTLTNHGASPYDVAVTLSLAAADKPVTITKPTNVTPIQSLLSGMGLTTPGSASSTPAAAGASPSSSASSADTPLSTSYTVTSQSDGVDNSDEADIGQTVPLADS